VDTPPLLLVCDGIGGHEQGSVASQTAVKLLRQELEPLVLQPQMPPAAVAQRLREALILANDSISERNNDEKRSARARMGTTVVLALVHFPYVAIANIGDSRAYRISAHTCYQITVDDDVASREAQMGYALYSEAIQLPSSGALIQALGINESGFLYPTVQHLLMDDPALLLLCSDGLSDYDRVEALAPHLVAPLTAASGPLGAKVAELIQQANRLNGHDNVTVGLMRFAPQVATLTTLPGGSLRQADAATGPDFSKVTQGSLAQTLQSTPPTTLAVPGSDQGAPARSGFAWGPFVGGIAVVLATLGAVGLAFGRRQPAPLALQPLAPKWPIAAVAGQPLRRAALAATADIPVGSFWQTDNGAGMGIAGGPLRLLGQPSSAAGPESGPPAGTAVATGSILRVVSRQTASDNTNWVRLQVCSIPSGASLDQPPQESDQPAPSAAPDLNQQLLAPGEEGWVDIRQLYTAAATLGLVTPAQAGRCVS
jgi:serine/threonine protein phosphatase PrpC